MKRVLLAALAVTVGFAWWLLSPQAEAQTGQRVQWIWFDEPAYEGPRYFRRVFAINRPVQNPVDEGILDVGAGAAYTVWVNGQLVGKGEGPQRVQAIDVKKHLVHGNNVIAIEAHPGKFAGLMARLGYIPNGMSKLAMVSDGAWQASKTAADGWQSLEFKAAGWSPVKVLGAYNQIEPKNLTWDQGGDDRFSVPAGFRVEEAVHIPASDKTFSLVNMCFDDKGRLLVSREGGPILLCTDPDKNGVLQKVQPYCTQVTNCQGMCWVKDALLLVGNGPQGTGLYRVRDTDGDDKTDQAELLHKFKGGMSEHGPHAILHGPDDWLYVVAGNHAWAQPGENFAKNSPLTRWPKGDFGPDQGDPNTTEDVLLPRLNDARGHAANILAPGGTIWRLDHQGKNMSLVAAGFRNHFDAAFNPHGELFTFDSDMEWDEALPWYRAVRVCHCPPGADFVWRTGAANTPDYYIDSLPPIAETGRGSPVGLEFYDHHVFPKKYQGAYFLADWAIGVIFAVHLERDGASYKAKVERFCKGAPMNVTDLQVGPDGALYFTMGGRGTQGGVYRIAYAQKTKETTIEQQIAALLALPQPLSAWSRANQRQLLKQGGSWYKDLRKASESAPDEKQRLRALDYLCWYFSQNKNFDAFLEKLALGGDNETAGRALDYLGSRGVKISHAVISASLSHPEPLIRRKACDALIRAGIDPPLEKLWPLLGDSDRFVRHAARLALERIDPAKWAGNIAKETSDMIAWNAIIALCQTNQAQPRGDGIFARLDKTGAVKTGDTQGILDYLRTLQMALMHVQSRPDTVTSHAERCAKLFPHEDWRVNRELAIVLTHLQREAKLAQPIQPKVITALLKAKDDRLQQIHYAYCLRLLKDGWTSSDKQALLAWYDTTKTWSGGHSFTPFLENIFRESLQSYSPQDYKTALAAGEKTPLATLVIAQRLQLDRHPEVLPELGALANRLAKTKIDYRGPELIQAVEDALARTALGKPSAESLTYLVKGLATKNPLLRSEALATLYKLDKAKPKGDDPSPFRTVLQATPQLGNNKEKWQTIELMRRWTGQSFGSEPENWEPEWKLWARWFAQNFPKEPPLPFTAAAKPAESKYKLEELLSFLDNDPAAKKADPVKGRVVFEKAQCIRCHKFGKEGEGVGPDLTTLSKRFKRIDILDAIISPSKVISDQYRSVTITTTRGQTITGLAAVQGDTVTVLLNDASKVTLKKSEIESQVASLVSVMPERALDPLTRQEIADLIAFLESEPK